MKVKATVRFNDYEGKEISPDNLYRVREAGEVFECDEARYKVLKEHEVAVAVIEKEPITMKRTGRRKKGE